LSLSVGRKIESITLEIFLVLCQIPAVVYPFVELETVGSQRWLWFSSKLPWPTIGFANRDAKISPFIINSSK
jgi:hypothetical protein